jgi:hypothetical protein
MKSYILFLYISNNTFCENREREGKPTAQTQQQIAPFLAIHSSTFRKHYDSGLWRHKHGDEQQQIPMPDSYLVECLEVGVAKGWFDGPYQDALEQALGFALGMVHGGILTPVGEIRPDVHTLVAITNQEFGHGDRVVREWYFTDATPEERLAVGSDTSLLGVLTDLVKGDRQHFLNGRGDGLIYWAVGDYLGEISGCVFPIEDGHNTEPLSQHVQQALQAAQ